ncbi:MAG TPA: hypothetical protein VGP68_01975 [Gemmataceae bacterium]|nr:hypothetical protein [Gemmataceae bacterium]
MNNVYFSVSSPDSFCNRVGLLFDPSSDFWIERNALERMPEDSLFVGKFLCISDF